MIHTESKPPDYHYPSYEQVRLFLAGSIEQGSAELWQNKIVNEIEKSPGPNKITIFNPRRDKWDASWSNSPDFLPFNEQVTWELDYITSADVVFFYFDPNTKSPIALLELGILLASRDNRVIICCPEAFWRYGNVKITANYFGEAVYTDFEQAKEALIKLLSKPHKRVLMD